MQPGQDESGGEDREVPVASLWVPGRNRGIVPSLSAPFGQNPPSGILRPLLQPASLRASGRQSRRGMSSVAVSKRRWVGGEVTAAFPWLT